MAFTPITDDEIQVGKPIKKRLLQKIKDNESDMNDRIIALDTAGGNTEVWSVTLRDLKNDLGNIVTSQLSEAEFRKLNGNQWYLCDGQSIIGTEYAALASVTVAPDFRGEFLRGLDNGRGVDTGRTMNSAQGFQATAHTHDQTFLAENPSATETAASGSGYYRQRIQSYTKTSTQFSTGTTTNSNETRPRNVSVNYFIKCNPTPRTQILMYQARKNFSISEIKITNIQQNGYPAPTSGQCKIDIRKGDLTTMTSIFTSVPTITSFTNGSQNGSYVLVDGAESVAEGQWIVLDITQLFPGQQCLVISVYGVPLA